MSFDRWVGFLCVLALGFWFGIQAGICWHYGELTGLRGKTIRRSEDPGTFFLCIAVTIAIAIAAFIIAGIGLAKHLGRSE
jgi:hypothetical protein